MGIKQIRIIVKGRVQGVFFRNYTKEYALSLKIQGKVRNLKNGDVEILAKGDSNQIDDLIKWAHKGSPLSKVEELVVIDIKEAIEFPSDFYVENGRF